MYRYASLNTLIWQLCGVHKLSNTEQNGTTLSSQITEFCKNILQVQRRAPNSACRAELGQHPLPLNIQKWALHFWNHIKTSDPISFSYAKLGRTLTKYRQWAQPGSGGRLAQTDLAAQRGEVVFLLWAGSSRDKAALPNSLHPIWRSQRQICCKDNTNIFPDFLYLSDPERLLVLLGESSVTLSAPVTHSWYVY